MLRSPRFTAVRIWTVLASLALYGVAGDTPLVSHRDGPLLVTVIV